MDYERLAQKRPPAVTRGHWEYLVGSTLNLHENWGVMQGAVRVRRRTDRLAGYLEDRLAGYLEDRLRRPVSAAIIDWIWNKSLAFLPGSRSFDLTYLRDVPGPGFLIVGRFSHDDTP